MRIHVDGRPFFFPDDFDASKLIAPGPGKLLKYLIADGEHVEANKPYCEIEVMKTVMPLIATSSGVISHVARIGAILEAGDVLCDVAIEDTAGFVNSNRSPGSLRKCFRGL